MSAVLNAERIRRDVVVLGASAGGVSPLRELLAKLPADIEAAIAVVLHRSPVVASALAAVLGWRSALPTHDAVDGAALTPGRVFVAPRDQHLIMDDGILRLSRGPKEHHTRPAIDPLFRSAARSYARRVVGVLLSGTGDDGVSGLIAITAAGGITLVQDPAEAAYPQMPRSGILNDRVQAALGVGEIADTLTALSRGESVTLVQRPA